MIGGAVSVGTHYTRVATYSNMVKRKRSPVQLRLPTLYRHQMMRRTSTKSPIKMLTPQPRYDNDVYLPEQKRLDSLRWRMKFEDECEMLEDHVTMQE